MVRGDADLIIGLRGDPQFSPIVLVGFGGVLVEILGDVAIAPAPVSADQAMAMLRRLKLWPLLLGARGRQLLDTARLSQMVERLSWLGRDLGPRLIELELNPVLVGPASAIAVDGRATLGA